jgi:hypothetical protein
MGFVLLFVLLIAVWIIDKLDYFKSNGYLVAHSIMWILILAGIVLIFSLAKANTY